MVNFLNSWNILSLLFLGAAYAVYGGTKTVGRLNEVLFYTTFIVFLIPIFSLKEADILNLQPVLGSGIKKYYKCYKKKLLYLTQGQKCFLYYILL